MAKRAARASLAGGIATANVWEVERRELPFIALPRLPASHCACVLFAHFVSFSSCNNRSGNWHQRTKQPAQGHTAGPGVESRAVSSAKLFLLGHTGLLGPAPSRDGQEVGPAMTLPP